jgi:glycosyltransferase involved in cell wall biosynthesis
VRYLELAIILSTYQRPWYLRRSLLSIALQRGVAGQIEVVVTDDGSQDETRAVVDDFSRTVDFPVRFTTHAHDGFRLARCHNEGVAQSAAPYLLFTDSDCLLPPDHCARHLRCRRPGLVIAGDAYRLDPVATVQLTETAIRSGKYQNWVSRRERLRITTRALRSWVYWQWRHAQRPRLTGCNIGVWRDDYERVNGFDENYVGWGLEDRDLQLRLSRLGLRFKSILGQTVAYHQWHPAHQTFARNNEGTPNLRYYQRGEVRTQCLNGLVKIGPPEANQEPNEGGPVILPFPTPAAQPQRVAA